MDEKTRRFLEKAGYKIEEEKGREHRIRVWNEAKNLFGTLWNWGMLSNKIVELREERRKDNKYKRFKKSWK